MIFQILTRFLIHLFLHRTGVDDEDRGSMPGEELQHLDLSRHDGEGYETDTPPAG
jgi:hypothetical protein